MTYEYCAHSLYDPQVSGGEEPGGEVALSACPAPVHDSLRDLDVKPKRHMISVRAICSGDCASVDVGVSDVHEASPAAVVGSIVRRGKDTNPQPQTSGHCGEEAEYGTSDLPASRANMKLTDQSPAGIAPDSRCHDALTSFTGVAPRRALARSCGTSRAAVMHVVDCVFGQIHLCAISFRPG